MPAKGYKKRRARWSEQEVLAKVREWHDRYGDIPSATDWNGSDSNAAARRSSDRAQAWLRRAQRFEQGEWPWTGTVFKMFGGWNQAMRAAGFEPRPAYRNGVGQPTDVTAEKLVGLARSAQRAKNVDTRRLALYELASGALELAGKDTE